VAKRKKRTKDRAAPERGQERASTRAEGADSETGATETAREPKTADRMGTVLFCPFCRESFEDLEKCPDHDLALVPFERLPKRGPAVHDDEPLPLHEPRYGRAIVVGGAALAMVGFVLPLATTVTTREITVSGLPLAMTRMPHLWAVPLVAIALVAVLLRARTLRRLRSIRLAVPAIAFLGITALAYAAYSIVTGARALEAAAQREISVTLEIGFWITLAGFAIATAGGLVLGRVRHREDLPHGAGPDADDPIGRDD
jgi:hypothetical protein